MSRFSVLKDECNIESKNNSHDSKNTSKEASLSNKPKKKKNKKPKPTFIENVEDNWIEKDQEICDLNYQKDIEEAILQSKLELEKQRQKSESEETPLSKINANGDDECSSKAAKAKNRNKNRTRDGQNITLSLNEFHSMNLSNKEKPVISSEAKSPTVDNLFDDVHQAAKRLVDKEKDKEEYERRYKVEAVIRGQYIVQLEEKQNIIDKQDNEIVNLKTELDHIRSVLDSTHKEKQKLEKLLHKGKLSDVASLIQQIDELSQMRDDLTNQIMELTADFEKERSISHSLRSELDRLKAAKSHK